MKDFLVFRHMLTPFLVQIIFWLGVLACIVTGVVNIAHDQVWKGLQILIGGPIAVRIMCEFVILFFRINETLTEIKNEKQK